MSRRKIKSAEVRIEKQAKRGSRNNEEWQSWCRPNTKWKPRRSTGESVEPPDFSPLSSSPTERNRRKRER